MTPPHSTRFSSYFRKHYAIPPEHGAWIWWIGPLLIGAAAGQRIGVAFLLLTFAALAVFLFRHPLTLLVKVTAGRRGKAAYAPAIFWMTLYGVAAAAGAAGLIAMGNARVLWLGTAAIPVLVWYFVLVVRRDERHHILLDLLTGVVMGLTAPAAYWVCGGADRIVPWMIWQLVALHTCATILHVTHILNARRAKLIYTNLPLRQRLAPCAPHAIGLVVSIAGAYAGWMPSYVVVAFAYPVADSCAFAIRPPNQMKPSRIGMRQLAQSTIFTIVMMAAYAG